MNHRMPPEIQGDYDTPGGWGRPMRFWRTRQGATVALVLTEIYIAFVAWLTAWGV